MTNKKRFLITLAAAVVVMALIHFWSTSQISLGAPQVFISTPATTSPTGLQNFSFAIGTSTAANQFGSTTLAVYGSTTIQTWKNTLHALEVFNAASTSIFRVDTIGGLIAVAGGGTSTFSNGITLTAGCLIVGGSCLSTGVSGSGAINQIAYFDTTSSVAGTTTQPFTIGRLVATTTATSTLQRLTFTTTTGTDLSLSGALSVTGSSLFPGGVTITCTDCITDANVVDSITLTNITQITNRAISDTTGTLTVSRGGTGATALGLNALLVGSDTGAIVATSSPTVNYITATSTTPSSFTGLTSSASSSFVSVSFVNSTSTGSFSAASGTTFRIPSSASSTMQGGLPGAIELDETDLAIHAAIGSTTQSFPSIRIFGITLASTTASDHWPLPVTQPFAFNITEVRTKMFCLATSTLLGLANCGGGYDMNLTHGTSQNSTSTVFTTDINTTSTSTFTVFSTGFNDISVAADEEWFFYTKAASSSRDSAVIQVFGRPVP